MNCGLIRVAVSHSLPGLHVHETAQPLRPHIACACGMYKAVHACVLSHFSCVRLLATPWTVACQASLSMGFSRQEYWTGLPFPSPGDLPDPGIEPPSLMSPALVGGFFATSATWEAVGLFISFSVGSDRNLLAGYDSERPLEVDRPGICVSWLHRGPGPRALRCFRKKVLLSSLSVLCPRTPLPSFCTSVGAPVCLCVCLLTVRLSGIHCSFAHLAPHPPLCMNTR